MDKRETPNLKKEHDHYKVMVCLDAETAEKVASVYHDTKETAPKGERVTMSGVMTELVKTGLSADQPEIVNPFEPHERIFIDTVGGFWMVCSGHHRKAQAFGPTGTAMPIMLLIQGKEIPSLYAADEAAIDILTQMEEDGWETPIIQTRCW